MRIKLTVVCSLLALALPASASAVVGGKAVQPGNYPFVVAVGDTEGPFCGGTLISPSVVLTAAHCITGKPTALEHLRVLVGSPRITADRATDGASHVLGVTAVYVHPKFSERFMHYDAALLILDHPVRGVRTVPMADSSPLAGTTVSAAGWGLTDERNDTMPNRLRSVILKVGTTRECRRGNKILGEYFAPSMMCASNPGRDTCSGDSGGPLVGTSNGHTILIGITSFGYGCAQDGHPGVYTRVSAIHAWVVSQLERAAAAAAVPALPANP
jgi:secreted trypsin-like serine protease